MHGDTGIGDKTKNGTLAESNPLALRSGAMPRPFLPRRGYADGPFGQIHFRDTGSGVPLLLCHQAPQSSKQFSNVLGPLLRRGIRAIAFDIPGYGESDPADFVPCIEDWAAVVPALLDHLALDSAHLLGHHTGSLVVTEAALRFEDRVDRLILNGPVPMSAEERREQLVWVREREVEEVYDATGTHFTEAYKVRWDMFGDNPDPKLITRYTVERFQGYAPMWIGHHAAFLYDHVAALEKLRCPTMILTNTGDVIYEEARTAAKLRPDFSYTELEGGGVDIVDQQPEAWADAVARFLLAKE